MNEPIARHPLEDVLEKIYNILRDPHPRKDFNARRFALAAAAFQTIQFEIIPHYYYIILDATSTAGAQLEIIDGEFPSAGWMILVPGEAIKFPAKVARQLVRNPGTQTANFTIIALGDDDVSYES